MSAQAIRSALFVPGNRPERFGKALDSGADAVIVDFEDAVAECDKAQARLNLMAFLERSPYARVLVRVNASGHREHDADLQLCRRLPGVAGVMLPKAELTSQVVRAGATGKPVWPIVETAKGVLAIERLAMCVGVDGLTFGALDLALDLGMRVDSAAAAVLFDQVRAGLVLHSRANDLMPPLDSVWPAFADEAGLAVAMGRARDMGMGGALCIHPRQVAVVHGALAPGAEELAWARRVLEAAVEGGAVFEMDGQMVDAPVLARARRLLARGC